MNATTGQSPRSMHLYDLSGKPVWQTALEVALSQTAVTANPEPSTYFSAREPNSRLPRRLGTSTDSIYQRSGPTGFIPASIETLNESLGRRIVGSRRKSSMGLGTLAFVDLYGEKHFGFLIPGEDTVIIDDWDQFIDGGLVASKISGSALINANGQHNLVPFGEGDITEHGVVKVRLESDPPLYRWLAPPTPGGNWVNRPVQYVGHQNPRLVTVSLQSYILANPWEYEDMETREIVPIQAVKIWSP